jgi:hypothetical protein
VNLADPGSDFFPEAFLTPSKRGWATNELTSYGRGAVPLLRAILDGSAVNRNGVPYRRLGMPVDCALVTVKMLGPAANSLRKLVQAEVDAGHPYAEAALRALD